MYYSDELVEEVRSRSDIVDVIGRYVKLQKRGSNHIGLCPFHNEKTPSFSVSQSKQIYKCFGCGESGNVYTFVMKYENYTFPEAVKSLADSAGIALPEVEYSKEAREREDKRNRLLELNKEAAKYFYFQLRAPQGEKGLKYLTERKLSDETMKKFGLGYSNITSDDLANYLKSKGYEEQDIVDAGLASFDERFGFHDKFWNRVMFPISDMNHKVIGFGGRVMGDAKPKYLNSQETLIFDKSRNLYGLNFAKSSRRPYVILCEGYMDVIAMHQAGFDCAVASLGTAFTMGQANILKRYQKDVVLAYDSDEAGIKAALRAISILKDVELTGKVLSMAPYKDPDEFIKNEGAEKFEERIKNAENSFMFEIRILGREFDLNDPESKSKYYKEIARKICEFSESLTRDNYIDAVSRYFDIPRDDLKELVLKYAMKAGNVEPVVRPRSGIQNKKDPEDNKKKPQRMLLTWLVDEPAVYEKIKKYISVDDFTHDMYKKVAERLFAELSEGIVNPAAIINMFTDEESQKEVALLFSTEVGELDSTKDKEKALKDILYSFKKNSLEYYNSISGSDVNALSKVIQGKKDLEDIKKIHISFEE